MSLAVKQGLRFNGLTDYVRVPSKPSFDGWSQVIVEATLKMDIPIIAPNTKIVSRRKDSYFWFIGVNGTGYYGGVGNGVGTVLTVATTTTPSGNVETLKMTFDNTTRLLSLYINNVLAASGIVDGQLPLFEPLGGRDILIGASTDVADTIGQYFKGNIYAVKVSNQNGVVAQYSATEGQGTVATDSSGNGNNGTINGATWLIQKSQPGMRFSGTDYVNIPAFNFGTGDFTAEVMLNFPSVPSTSSVAIGDAGGLATPWIGINSSGQVTFALAGTSISSPVQTPNNVIHIVATRLNGVMNLYVNGVSQGTANFSAGVSLGSGASIGRFGSGGSPSFYYKGTIYSIRLYNRALSASEVTANYKGQVTRTGLVGEWLMQDDGSGKVTDTSGNGNHGTINGATFLQRHAPQKPKKNMYNVATGTDGYYVAETLGSLVASASSTVSDYIPVKANTAYTSSSPTASNKRMVFYDFNKTFISGQLTANASLTSTSPSNAAFARISYPLVDKSYGQMEQGSTATAFEAYQLINDIKASKRVLTAAR